MCDRNNFSIFHQLDANCLLQTKEYERSLNPPILAPPQSTRKIKCFFIKPLNRRFNSDGGNSLCSAHVTFMICLRNLLG